MSGPKNELTEHLLALRERLLPVLRRSRVQKAIVFGSFARGEASRHSDLDLILVQQTDRRFLDRYDGLLCELSRAVPERDLDVLIYTPTCAPLKHCRRTGCMPTLVLSRSNVAKRPSRPCGI
jgi:predicted nucleotidyltransferase